MTPLLHNFKTKAHDLPRLFKDTMTLKDFCKKLEKQALIDPDRYPINKYLGDGFEFFIELLLYLHPCDNRLGVYNYKPNQINDNGVDGTGVNINLQPCVVQVKYRSNATTHLTTNEDNLSNLITDGMASFHVVFDQNNSKNYRHFIFTTAAGLNFYTDAEMFKSKVKCFGNKAISNLIDHNLIFWDKANEIIHGPLQ
jgi:hypothetical protein